MITNTTIHKGFIGDVEGWAFSVYYNGKSFANLISALYKTKREATAKRDHYIKTGKYDTYGSAE